MRSLVKDGARNVFPAPSQDPGRLRARGLFEDAGRGARSPNGRRFPVNGLTHIRGDENSLQPEWRRRKEEEP